jgi:DNA invertase Pin-like site-specific DNA recombinase
MTTTTGTLVTAIYCRLSQDRDGTKKGTDRQEKDCRALAKREGFTVAEVFIDDDRSAYSGKSRPAFERMMKQLDRYDAVIYWKTDRLCRRISQFFKVLDACQAANTRLISVVDPIDTSTAMGQGVAGMLAAVAQQESENTGRRVKRAAEDRAQAGRPHGHRRAYGYAKDGTTIIEDEAANIREAVARIQKGESMYAIVTDWNARGIPATNGGPWVVTTLRQMLVSPRIAGQRTHHGEAVGKAAWLGIISEDEHAVVRAILDANGNGRHRRPRTGMYLCSGLLTCGRCGETLHSAFRSDGNGDRRYMCHNAPGCVGCGALTVAADAAERFVEEALLYTLESPAVERALRKPKRKAAPLASVHALEGQVVQLGLDHDAGVISRAEWLARRGPLVEKITAAYQAATAGADTSPIAQFRGTNVRELWDSLDVDRRRAVLSALVEQVTVRPATTRGRGFDTARIGITWNV